jgi:hypothetical protein
VKPPQAVNAYLSEPNYLQNTVKYSGQQKEQEEQIMSYLVTNKPLTFDECIVWARLQFERDYNNDIRQLLFSLPKDAVTSTGQPFWSGPKRAPDPLTFNSNDVSCCPTHGLTDNCCPVIASSIRHCSCQLTCFQLRFEGRNRPRHIPKSRRFGHCSGVYAKKRRESSDQRQRSGSSGQQRYA